MFKLLIVTSVLGLALAGCGSASDSDAKASPSPSPVMKASAPVNQASVLKSRYVQDYKAQFPKLAKGQSDKNIASDAATICNEIVAPGAKRSVVVGHVVTITKRNGIRPNDSAVLKIMDLAVKDACPQRTSQYKKLMGV